MNKQILFFIGLVTANIICRSIAFAYDAHIARHHHAPELFYAFEFEAASGGSTEGHFIDSELDGWIGGDYHKFWIKNNISYSDATLDTLEVWGMYSRYLSTFWDLQVGARVDTEPKTIGYLVAGINGLAPYFIETEFHLFFSHENDLSARISLSKELLITQSILLEPFIEADFSTQTNTELEIGRGLSEAEFGLQLRYSFHPKFSPFIEVHYDKKFGRTAQFARDHNERRDNTYYGIGLNFLF